MLRKPSVHYVHSANNSEREGEIHYVHWASKAYEDESVFMSEREKEGSVPCPRQPERERGRDTLRPLGQQGL